MPRWWVFWLALFWAYMLWELMFLLWLAYAFMDNVIYEFREEWRRLNPPQEEPKPFGAE